MPIDDESEEYEEEEELLDIDEVITLGNEICNHFSSFSDSISWHIKNINKKDPCIYIPEDMTAKPILMTGGGFGTNNINDLVSIPELLRIDKGKSTKADEGDSFHYNCAVGKWYRYYVRPVNTSIESFTGYQTDWHSSLYGHTRMITGNDVNQWKYEKNSTFNPNYNNPIKDISPFRSCIRLNSYFSGVAWRLINSLDSKNKKDYYEYNMARNKLNNTHNKSIVLIIVLFIMKIVLKKRRK